MLRIALAALLLLAPVRADDPPPLGQSGWEAELALDRGKTGVWTVKAWPIFDSVGSDEIVALDDEGRLSVLIPYSGRWTALDCIHEGSWLGGLAYGDYDAQVPGAELYTGGERGDLWQVVPHPHGTLEARLIGHLDGREVHTIVLDDLEPDRPGLEMVFFTWPGGLYRVVHGERGPAIEKIADIDSRIRDAVVLPGDRPRIATVSRGGALSLLTFEGGEPHWREVFRVKTGMGRIARRGDVLYTVCDDGCVYRFAGPELAAEMIYAGPAGMRGVVTGRFHADPATESLAVFGYSGDVELLTRDEGGWRTETLFTDRDKGHWLCTAEVDGRNVTDEILCCGYGGRVVMLRRPAGYGREGVLATGGAATPVRIGFSTVRRAEETVTPLVYFGGFRAKTLVFETLARCDDAGNVVPGLAESWQRLDDGRRWIFTLRGGVRFHDGAPCDAAAVAASVERWRGRPEHAWLPASRLLTDVRVVDPRRVEFTLSEPYPLPRSLVAINPTAVCADGERSVGTGPFRVVRRDPLESILLQRVDDGAPVELKLLEGGDHVNRSQIRALAMGEIDVAVDGWVPQIPRDEARRMAMEDRFELVRAPGTSTVHLAFSGETFAARVARRSLAACLDRAALAGDLARPAPTLFGGSVAGWPETAPVLPAVTPDAPLRGRLLVYEFDPDLVRLAQAVARQAARAGIDIAVDVATRTEYVARRESGDFDLVLDRTHGTPYDPHLWLSTRFLGDDAVPPAVSRAVRREWEAVTDEERAAAYLAIENAIAEEAWVVPLVIPDRIALVRQGLSGFRLPRCGYELDLRDVHR